MTYHMMTDSLSEQLFDIFPRNQNIQDIFEYLESGESGPVFREDKELTHFVDSGRVSRATIQGATAYDIPVLGTCDDAVHILAPVLLHQPIRNVVDVKRIALSVDREETAGHSPGIFGLHEPDLEFLVGSWLIGFFLELSDGFLFIHFSCSL